MSNLEIPVPESDFNYVATLADQHSLQIVFEGKNIIRESDKTTWIYLGPYEARQMAAILLGFADSCDGGVAEGRKERGEQYKMTTNNYE